MKLLLASIASRPGTGPAQALLTEYTGRLAAYMPLETQLSRTEQAFLDSLAKHRARTAPLIAAWLILRPARHARRSARTVGPRSKLGD